jgi:TatD family-associated radical SAM protein
VNITNACLNECLFCIKRNGSLFFGHDLSLRCDSPEAIKLSTSLENLPTWDMVEEIVFCGMGEPLLRYDYVLDVCHFIKKREKKCPVIRVDTSGLFWGYEKRLDILNWIDILSVSLNAENAEKYAELCQPRITNAYEVLMDFLKAVKKEEAEKKSKKVHFPKVRLSIVDTSEEEFIPDSGRSGYAPGTFPVPDFEACQKIADEFGWPLIVKRLFRDSCDKIWNDPAVQDMCARGVQIERCNDCTYRH